MTENLYFKNTCNEKDKNICLIYVHEFSETSAQTTKDQIKYVSDMAMNYKKDKLRFFWTDTKNVDFQETFEEEEPARPYILVVKGKRQRASIYEGEINQNSLENLADSLIGGNIRFKKMKFPLQFKDPDNLEYISYLFTFSELFEILFIMQ